MLVTSSIAPHLVLFLSSCLAVVPLSRPARADAPRARAVKAGRRAVLTSCSTAARRRLDGPSTARGSSRLGRRLLRLDALEGASLVENRPGDPGELVGERNRQHVVVQSFLSGFDPRFEAIALPTLDLDQHNPRGLHKQRAQVAIAAPEDRAVAGR